MSCIDPIDEQAIIEARIEKKIKEYQVRRTTECRLDAIRQSENYVDSLITNWVGNEVIDTFTFPNRPNKPTQPNPIIGTVKKFNLIN